MAISSRSVTARLGEAHYAVEISARTHRIPADEPIDDGGGDSAPRPHELLLAGLASCTLITLRMYAERKGWELHGLDLTVTMNREQTGREVETDIHLAFTWPEHLTAEQCERLTQIAQACPVHRTLTSPLRIHTTPPGSAPA